MRMQAASSLHPRENQKIYSNCAGTTDKPLSNVITTLVQPLACLAVFQKKKYSVSPFSPCPKLSNRLTEIGVGFGGTG